MALMKTANVDQFGFLLHDAARLLRKRFEARGSEYGLSAAQWRLLVRVVKEGSATQSRLTELLEIEPISVSRLVDRMEQGGWVTREADRNDRRVKLVVPTGKSVEAFSAIKAVAGDVYSDAMVGLDDAQIKTLMTALQTIVANLSNQETPASQAANHSGTRS